MVVSDLSPSIVWATVVVLTKRLKDECSFLKTRILWQKNKRVLQKKLLSLPHGIEHVHFSEMMKNF